MASSLIRSISFLSFERKNKKKEAPIPLKRYPSDETHKSSLGSGNDVSVTLVANREGDFHMESTPRKDKKPPLHSPHKVSKRNKDYEVNRRGLSRLPSNVIVVERKKAKPNQQTPEDLKGEGVELTPSGTFCEYTSPSASETDLRASIPPPVISKPPPVISKQEGVEKTFESFERTKVRGTKGTRYNETCAGEEVELKCSPFTGMTSKPNQGGKGTQQPTTKGLYSDTDSLFDGLSEHGEEIDFAQHPLRRVRWFHGQPMCGKSNKRVETPVHFLAFHQESQKLDELSRVTEPTSNSSTQRRKIRFKGCRGLPASEDTCTWLAGDVEETVYFFQCLGKCFVDQKKCGVEDHDDVKEKKDKKVVYPSTAVIRDSNVHKLTEEKSQLGCSTY